MSPLNRYRPIGKAAFKACHSGHFFISPSHTGSSYQAHGEVVMRMFKPALLFYALPLFLCLTVSSISTAASAPYPASQIITSMTWDCSTVTGLRKASGSDIWPLTWASDGNLYGAWGDGGGF